MKLHLWQEEVKEEIESRDSGVVMIVAPSMAGKTRLLKLLQRDGANYVTMRDTPVEELEDVYTDSTSVVAIDEAGMCPHYQQLLDAVSDHKNTVTVISTLPDVPSTEILQGHMDYVIDADMPAMARE